MATMSTHVTQSSPPAATKRDEPTYETHTKKETGYANVNGFKMYYEIEGEGRPAIYLPAALGTAGVTFLCPGARWR